MIHMISFGLPPLISRELRAGDMTEQVLNIVLVILAIGAASGPFVMAYLVIQMTKYFTPRSEFTALKEQLAREHVENKGTLDEMRQDNKTAIAELRHDIKSILQMKIEEHGRR